MKISYVVAESPGNVALKTAEYDPQTLKPDEVLLKNEYSVISAGTERARIIGQSTIRDSIFLFIPDTVHQDMSPRREARSRI